MKTFMYVITDKAGIHARPAGKVVKAAQKFQADLIIYAGEKQADASNLLGLMSLGVKYGDQVKVTAEGPDEEKALETVEKIFKENL